MARDTAPPLYQTLFGVAVLAKMFGLFWLIRAAEYHRRGWRSAAALCLVWARQEKARLRKLLDLTRGGGQC